MIRDEREEWTGLGGSKSKVFTPEEEKILKNFIVERVELGVGLTLHQVQDVMQEILLEAIKVNPTRTTNWADNMHLPTEKYVRGFLKRHNLTYRSTMSIHKGRAIVDPSTVDSWFDLTKERLLNDPELAECWKDPRRIFNQDETSLCVGSEHEKVLAPVGYHRPVYNLGGDSRAHTSISTIISGDGKYVGCRIVYKGVRNTTEKIANIPKDGITGEWRCSVSPEGYVNREVFQQGILADLVEHCETENIPKPVCIQCPV